MLGNFVSQGEKLVKKAQGLLPGITTKPWGHERIVAKTGSYVVKELFVKGGFSLSEQFHKKKTETMFLVGGDCSIQIGAQSFNPSKLTPIYIPPKTIHRVEAISDTLIIEVSSTELDDVERIGDLYGRA